MIAREERIMASGTCGVFRPIEALDSQDRPIEARDYWERERVGSSTQGGPDHSKSLSTWILFSILSPRFSPPVIKIAALSVNVYNKKKGIYEETICFLHWTLSLTLSTHIIITISTQPLTPSHILTYFLRRQIISDKTNILQITFKH